MCQNNIIIKDQKARLNDLDLKISEIEQTNIKVKALNYKINNLFNHTDVIWIKAKELESLVIDKWYYEGDIKYKILASNKKYLIAIMEWLKDSTIGLHGHKDANETTVVINGYVHSLIDNEIKLSHDKLYYDAGKVHEIFGKKGTLITSKFDYINR